MVEHGDIGTTLETYVAFEVSRSMVTALRSPAKRTNTSAKPEFTVPQVLATTPPTELGAKIEPTAVENVSVNSTGRFGAFWHALPE